MPPFTKAQSEGVFIGEGPAEKLRDETLAAENVGVVLEEVENLMRINIAKVMNVLNAADYKPLDERLLRQSRMLRFALFVYILLTRHPESYRAYSWYDQGTYTSFYRVVNNGDELLADYPRYWTYFYEKVARRAELFAYASFPADPEAFCNSLASYFGLNKFFSFLLPDDLPGTMPLPESEES